MEWWKITFEVREEGVIGSYETKSKIVIADTVEHAIKITRELFQMEKYDTRFPITAERAYHK